MPSAKVAAASARIAHSTSLLNCAILRVSGVERSVASAISHAMRPISVWSPVAQTTPSALPVGDQRAGEGEVAALRENGVERQHVAVFLRPEPTRR